MKRIKKSATIIFLIALGLIFLSACSSVDQQTKKDTKDTAPKSPAISEEAKKPKPGPATPQEIKEPPRKAPVAPSETPPEQKAAPKPPLKTTAPPPAPGETISQQNYYDMGMRYYSQEKYNEAKKAWQRVIKLGKRTALADKARENIKKVDQILKTLKEMSGR
jgi:hypothetical protein